MFHTHLLSKRVFLKCCYFKTGWGCFFTLLLLKQHLPIIWVNKATIIICITDTLLSETLTNSHSYQSGLSMAFIFWNCKFSPFFGHFQTSFQMTFKMTSKWSKNLMFETQFSGYGLKTKHSRTFSWTYIKIGTILKRQGMDVLYNPVWNLVTRGKNIQHSKHLTRKVSDVCTLW